MLGAVRLLLPKSTDIADFCLAESGSERRWSASDGAVGGAAPGLTSNLVAGRGRVWFATAPAKSMTKELRAAISSTGSGRPVADVADSILRNADRVVRSAAALRLVDERRAGRNEGLRGVVDNKIV